MTMVNNRRFFLSLVFIRKFRKPAYFHNPGTEPLRPLTVGQILDMSAVKWPDRTAVISVHEKKELTFAELKRNVRDQILVYWTITAEKLGAGLLKLGLKPGDRIAMLGGNSVHWFVTAMAAAKTGLILTGLNPNYVQNELMFTLRKVGVKAIIADSQYKNTDYFQMLSKVMPEITNAPSSSPITSKALPDLKYVIFETDKSLPGSYKYDDLLNDATSTIEVDEVSSRLQPDEPFNIQFTSGTTGTPKAALLSHFGAVNNAHFFGIRCGFHENPSTLCVQVPFFHVFGTVIALVCGIDHGITLVLPGPAFNRNETVKTLSQYKCTAIYGTPTMYVDVCEAVKEMLPSNEELKAGLQNFSVVVSGGAICSPQLFTEISHAFNCTNVQSAYGMSETSPVTFTNTHKDTFEQRTTTVGSVVEHQEVKVVDAEGRMVPFGSPGEAWFRGYSTMLGYWDDEDRTKEMITPSGWLKSGDQVVLSEQGYGMVVGRLKDQINRGGEKIMPSELEKLLETHPEIQEVHVHGVSDHRMGEEICACVRRNEGSKLKEEDVRSFCKGKIARFKIPRFVRFMNDFPKTGSGKVQKFELRKIIEEELKELERESA